MVPEGSRDLQRDGTILRLSPESGTETVIRKVERNSLLSSVVHKHCAIIFLNNVRSRSNYLVKFLLLLIYSSR